jgi:uncharacterized membrane protein
MRKSIPFLIVAAATIASLAVFPRLPATIPTHWGADGEINGTSPRLWGVVVMPVILLFIALMMRAIPAIDPRRENYPKFAGAFDAIFISTMLLLLVIHVAMLAAGLGYPVAMGRITPIAVGALFIVLGNVIPRARPNWFIGVRTPWTLSSDRVWEKTNRLAGYVMVVIGIAIVILGLSAVQFAPKLIAPFAAIAALGLVVYSYVEWRREGAPGSNSPSL